MASSKERVAYVIERLNIATDGNVSSRAMMGEYVVYYRDKVIGGIYDDRLLVKVTDSSRALLANASLEIPYAGAKEMLKIENIEDAAAIRSCSKRCILNFLRAKRRRNKAKTQY